MRALWSTATLGVGEAASRGATLVLTLLIARTAGIGFLAELTLAQTLLAYATVSADAGLTAHAVRRLGNREDPADVVRETTSVQTALCLVALVVVYPLAAERTGWLLASCLVLYSLASTLMPSYLLQGRQEFRKLALVRAVTALTTLSAGLIFLFAGSHVLVGLAYSLGALAGLYLTIRLSGGTLIVFFKRLTFRVRYRWFAASGWLIPQTVIVHVYASAVLIAGSFLLNEQAFALIATALKAQSFLIIPAVLLQTVLLPHFVVGGINPWKAAGVAGGFALVLTGACFALAPGLLGTAFGASAVPASPLFRIVCWQVPLAYASTVLLAFLVARARYGLSTAVYALAVVTLLAGLVVLGGGSGAGMCVAFVLAEAVFVLVLAVAVLSSPSRAENMPVDARVQMPGRNVA